MGLKNQPILSVTKIKFWSFLTFKYQKLSNEISKFIKVKNNALVVLKDSLDELKKVNDFKVRFEFCITF